MKQTFFALLTFLLFSITPAFGQNDRWLTNAPKFAGPDLPESPSQHQEWKTAKTDLPTNLVSSINFLFGVGMADPRGGGYREYQAVIGEVWGHTRIFKAHGWVFTAGPNHDQSFAVAWSGLVYPVIHVGHKADLKLDIESLLHADEAWRKEHANWPYPFIRSFGAPYEGFAMSETNMTLLKIPMLLRLGQTNLASQFWKAWNGFGTHRSIHTQSPLDKQDPFRSLATDWAWELFNRAVCAHQRGDDWLSVADCRKLALVWQKLESEARKRGFTPAPDFTNGRMQTNQLDPIFDFLKPLPALLADEDRRIQLPPHKTALQIGLDRFPTTSARISALISDLDEVGAHQWGQPGGVSFDSDPIVHALILEGDDAVKPLLDCQEHDHRLTRSVSFWRDFTNQRNLLSVSNAATAALDNILKVSFKSPAAYRAYWDRYQNVPLVERWYQTLRDDHAGREQWMQAAQNILARTDGTNFYLWRNAPIPRATNHFTYVAESLRTNQSPSVAELFARRALDIAPTNYQSSESCWKFQDAADLGLMLAEWDPRSALPALAKIIRRCPALYAGAQETWTSDSSEGLASLADAMASLGDTSGLDLYAKWIENKSFKDLGDAMPQVLKPLGLFPENPSIQDASGKLFLPEHREWLTDLGFNNPLKGKLVLNPKFQALVLEALSDTSSNGTFVLTKTNDYELQIKGGTEGGMIEPDSSAPAIGVPVSIRVCDLTAHNLTRIEGLPNFELYWPEKMRDEALASIITFLKKNGDHLKLKPVSWPPDNDN